MSTLQYHPLDISHAEGLLNIWGDGEVFRFTNMTLPFTLEDAKSKAEQLCAFEVFAVICDNQLIGVIGCPLIDEEKLHFGLFYQFCRFSWGQGYATASTKWLPDYMASKYKNATLFADVVTENIAGEKILIKFDFRQISQEVLERDGKKYDVNNYKLSLN